MHSRACHTKTSFVVYYEIMSYMIPDGSATQELLFERGQHYLHIQLYYRSVYTSTRLTGEWKRQQHYKRNNSRPEVSYITQNKGRNWRAQLWRHCDKIQNLRAVLLYNARAARRGGQIEIKLNSGDKYGAMTGHAKRRLPVLSPEAGEAERASLLVT